MIRILDYEVTGWKWAIEGMRNPLNSWDKSDSGWCYKIKPTCAECECFLECEVDEWKYIVGENDLKLMKKLATAGSDHRKFMRMITVYVSLSAPLYWWKEADTYKVGTVRNSCSTMHKIHSKEITLKDCSCEYLKGMGLVVLKESLRMLNAARESYIESKNKDDWYKMIQLLPSSYNQRATLMLNYEVLRNIYHSRKNHKLDEWHTFCDWIETLPCSELITGEA